MISLKFSPTIGAVYLHMLIQEYIKIENSGLPVILIFAAVPLLMNNDFLESINSSQKNKGFPKALFKYINGNESKYLEIRNNVYTYKQVSLESLLICLDKQLIKFSNNKLIPCEIIYDCVSEDKMLKDACHKLAFWMSNSDYSRFYSDMGVC